MVNEEEINKGSQMADEQSNWLLSVNDLSIAWGDVCAVRGASFQIAAGEKVALVGESGSGKSVTALSLLQLLSGAKVTGGVLFKTLSGTTLNILDASEKQMARIRGREIGMIFQEPMTALDPLFSVGNQIQEGILIHEGGTKNQAWAKAVELLDRTGIQEPHLRAHDYPHQLSGGQRQRVMIAMALACSPRLLLADEPTTALDVTLRVQIIELLNRLQQEDGMAVMLISHDLGVVRNFADRMMVMESGIMVEQGLTETVFQAPSHPYTQRLLNSRPRRLIQDEKIATREGSISTPLVELSHVSVRYPKRLHHGKTGLQKLAFWQQEHFKAVADVSICLQPGRTLGVIGESGSGKSSLAMSILGLLSPKMVQGQIKIDGQEWPTSTRGARVLRGKIQVVFQDPFSSLSPRMTVGDIVGEGLQIHHPHLNASQRKERVIRALEEVQLLADILKRYPHEFSGGQRQRIAIARALVIEPSVLVLDEPTSALDVSIQMQVLQLLAQLQHEKQLSYILITHDIGVIRALAQEVIVMKDGQVIESGTVEQILNEPEEPYTQLLVRAAKQIE